LATKDAVKSVKKEDQTFQIVTSKLDVDESLIKEPKIPVKEETQENVNEYSKQIVKAFEPKKLIAKPASESASSFSIETSSMDADAVEPIPMIPQKLTQAQPVKKEETKKKIVPEVKVL
jgi:hypothetical protein